MSDELQSVVQEIKEGVVEAVTPAITEKVMDEVTKKMAEIKPVHADKDMAVEESKKKAVETFKDLYGQLENGAKTVIKDLSTGDADDGADLVPEYFSSEVLRVAEKYGVIRRNARVVPMRGKTEQWPTLANVQVYRINEGSKITATSPKTDNVILTAKKVAAIIPMTRELLRDANVAVLDEIAKLAGEATAKLEDQWGMLGLSGTEGVFLNATVPELILAPGKTSYADADFGDLLSMLNLIDEDTLEGQKWYMSFAQFNAFRALVSSNDDRHIFQAPGAGMPATIWNLPVEFTKVMPRPTDENEGGEQAGKPFIALADLGHMLFGQRDSYELELSREATITSTDGTTALNLWEQDMVAVRVMERIDIQLSNPTEAYARMVTSEELS